MANKPLKSIKFPGLEDTYTLLQNDATLSVSGKAADAKATGDAFESAKDMFNTLVYPQRKSHVFNGVWSADVNHITIPVNGGDTVKITANANYLALVACLKSDNYLSGNAPDYATGWSAEQRITKNTSATITIPSDATILVCSTKRILYNPAGADYTPKSILINGNEVLFADFRSSIISAWNSLNRKAIQANTDLDNLTGTGAYLLFSGYTYSHAPAYYKSGAAWLITIETIGAGAPFRLQFFTRTWEKVWCCRSYSVSSGTGTWSDWVTYSDKYTALRGKTVSIIGDSISTYSGYLPQDYVWYYPQSGADVNSVNKTWWKLAADTCGMTIMANASWSGSSVCDDDDTPANNAKIAYSDARINDLAPNGTAPDIVIVLMGTNDFARNNGLGTLTETSEIPTGETSIRTFREAYACMVNKIRETYPHTHVYCCTLIQRYTTDDETYPILNGAGNALSQFNQAIMDIATWTGCNVIRLDTLFSLAEIPDYTIDEKLHPNAAGMRVIANQVVKTLINGETQYQLFN